MDACLPFLISMGFLAAVLGLFVRLATRIRRRAHAAHTEGCAAGPTV